MLGVAVVVAGCDVAKFALDPKLPSFEQTWNLPGTTKEVSVASLLPPGKASILADSSGFALSIDLGRSNSTRGRPADNFSY